MKTMKWLLKREFWEHKGMLYWAPMVVSGLIMLAVAGGALRAILGGHMHTKVAAHAAGMPAESREQLVNAIANLYLATSAPLMAMLGVIVFFYCLGALYDERRDRSILFWKSLPVSDNETVLSKVIMAACVAPLITIAMAIVMSIVLLMLGLLIGAFNGINLFGAVLSHSSVYLAPLQMVGMLPVYVLWALPTIGWLLMVSAWARSKVFLWAVGVPLLSILGVRWTEYLLNLPASTEWFAHNVVLRALTGLAPGAWLSMEQVDPHKLVNGQMVDFGLVFKESWLTLTGPSVWVGAIAGVAMIVAAMRLRRWKDEG